MLPSARKLPLQRQVHNLKCELILWPSHLTCLMHEFPRPASVVFEKCSFVLVGLQRKFVFETCTKTLISSGADSGFDPRLNIYHLFLRLYFVDPKRV